MSTNDHPEFTPIIAATPLEPIPLDSPTVRAVVDPNNPPWGLGGALIVLISSIAFQVIFALLFFLPYALARGLNPASPNFAKELTDFSLNDPTAVLLQVLALLPAHLLSVAIVWIVVTRFGKRPFLASLGWSWANRREIWISVGLGFLLFAVAWAIAWLLGTEKQTALEQIINSSIAARYSIAFLAVFTAPFVEEFIYRGVLYSALQRLVGVNGAVVIVLGLFTLIHVPQYWPNFGVIAAVGLLSIALTIIRAYTGRLLPCVLIHFIFNGIQSVILLLEPYLPRLAPTTEPTTSLILIIARLALSVP